MAFLSGLMQIEAPASALNNLGKIEGSMTNNAVGVKLIKARDGLYPYVSAQALRFWLRQTLEQNFTEWKSAPIYRETKVAYTDANPIEWWDDDIFGYMRAPSTKKEAEAARKADESFAQMAEIKTTVTRISPFRVGTMISLAPAAVVTDFGVMARRNKGGVMARHEGDPVLFEHQFYRATLQALLSLDLHSVGTFSYEAKTGYLNLDEVRLNQAKAEGLTHLEEAKSFRLPTAKRLARIEVLLRGLAVLDGGAKQALHYTDISPDVLIFAVIKGGNNIFGHIFGADAKALPILKIDVLAEMLTVYKEDIFSSIYWGWVPGYLDSERQKLELALREGGLKDWAKRFHVEHPRTVIELLVKELKQNPEWLS